MRGSGFAQRGWAKAERGRLRESTGRAAYEPKGRKTPCRKKRGNALDKGDKGCLAIFARLLFWNAIELPN